MRSEERCSHARVMQRDKAMIRTIRTVKSVSKSITSRASTKPTFERNVLAYSDISKMYNNLLCLFWNPPEILLYLLYYTPQKFSSHEGLETALHGQTDFFPSKGDSFSFLQSREPRNIPLKLSTYLTDMRRGMYFARTLLLLLSA